MFGSNSGWYFEHLAGIQQADGSRGWEGIRFKPQVWSYSQGESICSNLSSVEASLVTSKGVIGASWECGEAHGSLMCPPGATLGGRVREQWNAVRTKEISELKLECEYGGTITSV